MTRIKYLPYYPILFGIYPVIALLGVNITQVDPAVVWRPAWFFSLVSLVMMLLFVLLLHDWDRSALVTSILLLLFFTYGHLYNYLKAIEISGIVLGRHRLLAPIWFFFAGVGIYWLAES